MKEVVHFPAKSGDLGWFETSDFKDYKFNDPKSIEASYDFVIIGGGFAGVNAAFRLAELRPEASIALFEALPIGMGDSGRNAGFLIDVPHSFGEPGITLDDHKWRMKLNNIVINRMRKIIADNELKCDWDECGKYLAARNKRYIKHLEGAASDLDKLEQPYKMLEKEELPPLLGTDYYVKALYTYGTVLINPADVVRALATALPSNVHVFEESPVLQIQEGDPVTVRLVNGKKVTTGKALILASVFIDSFRDKEKGRIFASNSFGAFTRELTADELAELGEIRPWGCTSGHAAGTTVRITKTKRIFVRNGFTFSTHHYTSPQRLLYARKKLRKAYESRFPKLQHVNFEYVYGGMIPMSLNGESLFKIVEKNVFAAAVGDGAGLTRSSMLGLYLADWACGVDSEELRYLQKTSHPSWCPPEPLPTIGATARLAFEEFMAGEDI